MKQYINDFIETLTDHRQRRVGEILQEVLVSKENLNIIAGKLSSTFTQFTPLALSVVPRQSLIDGPGHYVNMRDFQLRVNELFTISGYISNLVDSHIGTLTSEIKALEDELIALEKLSSNYAFLLSDAKAYDFAYIEPFNDEFGREDQFDFPISDRANLSFGINETASIRSDEGVLCLSAFLRSQSLNAAVIESNCLAYTKESTPLNQALIEGSNTGWQVVIGTQGPITRGLTDFSDISGAQVVLEFTLPQPAPASEIKLAPFADYAVELLQTFVYPKDEDGAVIKLLSEKMVLDRPTTLHFPMQSVSRIRVVLNQPVYNRVIKQTNQTQDTSKKVKHKKSRIIKVRDGHHHHIETSGINIRLPFIIDALRRIDIQRIVRTLGHLPQEVGSINIKPNVFSVSLSTKVNDLDITISNDIPRASQESRWGNQTLDELLNHSTDKLKDLDSWTNNVIDKDFIFQSVFSLMPNVAEILRRLGISFNFNWPSPRTPPPPPAGGGGTTVPPPVPTPPPVEGYEYEYMLGLYHFGLGIGEIGSKGHFVSKALNVNGDIGQIKLKSSDYNYISTDDKLDSQILTSIEYAVSNKPNPSEEVSWVPILPVGTDFITSERFLPDIAGVGYFRFPADPTDIIVLYKNGKKLNVTSDNLLKAANNLSIIGIRIPFGQYTTEDFLTVDYRPLPGFDVVSFENEGFSQVPLISSFDSTGAGEGFTNTTGTNEISLQYAPYIDDDQVSASTYSTTHGTTPYQPIVVKFDDGTVATNLTNYSDSGLQTSLPISDDYYYIQSGQFIKFNQPVTKNFRVYYQHLDNNVRVRVVLRSNSKDFVSPKVDYFQVKAKTRRPTTKML